MEVVILVPARLVNNEGHHAQNLQRLLAQEESGRIVWVDWQQGKVAPKKREYKITTRSIGQNALNLLIERS